MQAGWGRPQHGESPTRQQGTASPPTRQQGGGYGDGESLNGESPNGAQAAGGTASPLMGRRQQGAMGDGESPNGESPTPTPKK